MAITIVENSRRWKALITITAGTPIFVAAGQVPIMADRILVQPRHGGTGLVLVYDDVPIGMAASDVAAGGDLAVELAPATSTAPGGTYTDTGGSIDLRMIAVDGSHSGDTVLIDAHLRL